jgi:membrane protein implicated in regulation of membrane protease activity
MESGADIVGRRGTVTVDIGGGGTPGEVLVPVGGGTEAYLAYADEPIGRGAAVVVYELRGGRMVDVTPLSVQESEAQ